MTAVRFGEGARYGLRLYGFVLVITVVGGAGVALGAALAWPEVQAYRGPGQAAIAPGVGGGVLAFLGLSVLVVGYVGTAYKLLADGVAAGTASGSAGSAAEEPTVAETAEPASADPNVGADAADATEGTKVGSMAAEGPAEDQPAEPPEPSPEEIAFGSSDGEAADPDPDPAGSTSDSLPGQHASADPLAERTNDE